MKNFGYQNDEDESLQSSGGGFGKFGLNTGFITEFKYNPLAGAGGTQGDAIDINLIVGEKEFRVRLFPVSKVYKGSNEIFEGDEGYEEEFEKAMKQLQATCTHWIKATGVTDQQLQQAFSQPVGTFAEYATILTSLVPANISEKPVDVFLHYQWSLKAGNKITFLEFPRDMKGGKFVVPSMPPVGSWKPIVDDKGLKYVDDKGNQHIFTRSATYMDSNRANQQKIEDQDSGNSVGAAQMNGSIQGNAGNSGWGD